MGFSKIKYMPYLRFYLDNLDSAKHDIHVLYWNRDLAPENTQEYSHTVLHEFVSRQEDNVRKSSKIFNFIRYRQFAKKLIRKEKYDLIIALHTFPAVLLFDKLTGKYKNKFIFDYRDETYEKYSFFKRMIHKLVRRSATTFVSSDGFRQLLPQDASHKIYTSHNFIKDSLDHRDDKKEAFSPGIIRISYWGFIRDERVNRCVIERISRDSRFELHYYGRIDRLAERLQEHAVNLGAQNIFFHGEYVPSDRYQFIQTTDIIHNVFGDHNMMIAMSNRFYDGLIFRIPQICIQNSVMGNRATSAAIGLACDPTAPDFTDALYEYVTSLNREEFNRACDAELKKILTEHQKGCQIIQNLVK